MSTFSYKDYDAIGLAELIRNKEVKAKEVVQEAIAQIEALNPQFNAVINKMYDQALKAAEGELTGAFAGVPMLLKDITQEVEGEPITSGSRGYQGYRAKKDAAIVQKLRETGVLFLGQTNVPELALVAYTEPKLYGPTTNPWNVGHTPGGSSGGSGAAVASGMVPIAGANDGGGSIRIPAAYCGLFGLKPSRGRTPVGSRLGRHWQGASVDHVLTRTVRDSAAMLDELSIYQRAAAFHAPAINNRYIEALQSRHHRPLRIAFSVKSPIGTKVDPACQEAVRKTVKLLESMGHQVEEKDAPVDGKKIAQSYLTMYFGEVAASLSDMEEVIGRKVKFTDVEPTTWLLGLLGESTSAKEFVLGLREWDYAANAMEEFHETYDYYVTPTTAFPPAKIGELEPSAAEKLLISVVGRLGWGGILKKAGVVDQMAEKSLERTPFTQLAGQPAMSVPMHQTSDGLPVGVQFMAARGREDMLYQMAAVLEQSDEWIDFRKNPFFALKR
jgi:amidase